MTPYQGTVDAEHMQGLFTQDGTLGRLVEQVVQ